MFPFKRPRLYRRGNCWACSMFPWWHRSTEESMENSSRHTGPVRPGRPVSRRTHRIFYARRAAAAHLHAATHRNYSPWNRSKVVTEVRALLYSPLSSTSLFEMTSSTKCTISLWFKQLIRIECHEYKNGNNDKLGTFKTSIFRIK